MGVKERSDRYAAQGRCPATPRQRRRIEKKLRRSLGFVPNVRMAELQGRKARVTPRQKREARRV